MDKKRRYEIRRLMSSKMNSVLATVACNVFTKWEFNRKGTLFAYRVHSHTHTYTLTSWKNHQKRILVTRKREEIVIYMHTFHTYTIVYGIM